MKQSLGIIGTFLLMLFFVNSNAQTINDYEWLVGNYTYEAENDVSDMGFVRVDMVTKGRDKYEYYWNKDKKFCLCMVSHLGEIQRVFEGTNSDCKQKGISKGAGAAIVGATAAALIGAALLSHKSNDRTERVDDNDPDQVAAFERGYRDGKYNRTYHNVYRDVAERNAYSDGFNEGAKQRKHETAHHTGHTDYVGHAYIGDLYGKNTLYGERQMRSRGFEMMDETKNKWGTHQYWYNYETHQCLDVTIANGAYEEIRTAQSYHCQRGQGKSGKHTTTKSYKDYRHNQYDDTGTLRCEINFRGENCRYGVERHGYNRADVYVTLPNGRERVFNFNGNRVGTPGGGMSINKTGDTWHLKVGSDKFAIPQSVINGY